MPNLDSACPKTYKGSNPSQNLPWFLIIFKNCPFDIKEGTIPNWPIRSFGHSVRSFGHLVIRPSQGTGVAGCFQRVFKQGGGSRGFLVGSARSVQLHPFCAL